MRPDRVRVGIVGIGFGQAVHAPAFRADPLCEIAGIAATTLDRATRVAERLGIPKAVGDWRELVNDPRIDAITLAVPPGLQRDIVCAAAAAGKHVFCEKPLARTVFQAQEMLQAVELAHVAHAIDFEFPELATWRAARSLCAEGRIGDLRHVYVDWRVETRARDSRSWKASDDEGGSVFGGFLSHILYHVEWLGGPIARVRARRGRSEGSTSATLDVWAELASGAAATASVATDAHGGSGHRVEVIGGSGTLRLENSHRDHGGPFALTVRGERLDAPEVPTPDPDGRMLAVSRLASRFLAAVRSGEPVRPNLVDGLRVQQLLAAVDRSIHADSWVVA